MVRWTERMLADPHISEGPVRRAAMIYRLYQRLIPIALSCLGSRETQPEIVWEAHRQLSRLYRIER